MSRQYGCIAFTDDVQAEQDSYGSGEFYRRVAERGKGAPGPDALGPREKSFLESVDSFSLATVSAEGWPYVQFRGGPPGFVRVLRDGRLAWADYQGNLQHVTTGNLRGDDRVAILAIDLPTRRRLKLFGRAAVVRVDDEPATVAALEPFAEPGAVIERAVCVTVTAYDWNCPQHITPRYTREQIAALTAPLHKRIEDLERENLRLRREVASE